MKLYLTFGSETIDFQGSGCKVLDGYHPQTPAGNEETLVEEFECLFIGTTAALKTLAQNVERLQRRALEDRNKDNPYLPVNLWFAVDDADTAWKARVYGGKIGLHEKLDHHYRTGRLKFSVALERDPFWEGAEAQAPLTNGNGTDNTSGLNVYNCNDGSGTSPNKRNCFAKIDPQYISGDLPGPARLAIVPPVNNLNGLFITHYADLYGWTAGVTDEIIKEVESWGSAGTDIADASDSGGYYCAYTIPTSWAELAAVGINPFYIGQHPIRFIMRFHDSPPAGTWVKIRLITLYGVVIETTPVLLSLARHQSLGILMPPLFYTQASWTLSLWAYNAGGGTLNCDVMYYPQQRSYIELSRSVVGGLGSGYTQIEQWNPRISDADFGVVSRGTFFDRSVGSGIFLEPKVWNWLYFLQKYGNEATITNFINVKCYYRPRRRSL